MQKLINTIALSVVALVAATGATAVQAQEREANLVKVSLQGVNFADQAQVATAYAKLKSVATEACQSGARDLATRAADRQCAADALSGAVRDLNLAQLSQLHEDATGRQTVSATYAARD